MINTFKIIVRYRLTENCSAISVICLGGINSKVFDPLIPHLDSRSSSDAWKTRRNSLYEMRPFGITEEKVSRNKKLKKN